MNNVSFNEKIFHYVLKQSKRDFILTWEDIFDDTLQPTHRTDFVLNWIKSVGILQVMNTEEHFKVEFSSNFNLFLKKMPSIIYL